MKSSRPIVFLLTLLITIGCFFSCEEIGPNINVRDTVIEDTTFIAPSIPAAQQKIVLLEDFTGVRCVNCPEGHELAENIKSTNPGQVKSVAIHTTFLGQAYDGDQDLRTDQGQEIEDFLGGYLGKPAGCVDRVQFPGDNFTLETTSKWAAYTTQRLALTPPVNITITDAEYDAADTSVTVRIELVFTQAVAEDVRLSVMLMENGIVVTQLRENDEGTGDIKDENYLHDHVLRDMFTSFDGLLLSEGSESGRTIIKSFKVKTSDVWDETKLEIVAFVHESNSKAVLQTAGTAVTF